MTYGGNWCSEFSLIRALWRPSVALKSRKYWKLSCRPVASSTSQQVPDGTICSGKVT